MSIVPEAAPLAEATPDPVGRRSSWTRFLRRPDAIFGIAVVVFFVVIAVLAPYIAPYGERERVGEPFEGPSASHWLGTDGGGRDMLTLMMWGARVSLIVGFAAAAVAILIGATIGILGGYFGGKTDTVFARLTDYFLVIPDIPLIIVIAAIWGRSLTNIIVIIGIIYWTTTARLVRSQVLTLRERVYVKRARALGAGHARIILRHVVPQVSPLVISLTVLTMAIAIFAETAIAFLGLGDPSLISWGKLIENAFQDGAVSVRAWNAIAPPGIAVALVILACTMVGRSLEDVLNPRLRVGHLSVHRFRLRSVPRGDE